MTKLIKSFIKPLAIFVILLYNIDVSNVIKQKERGVYQCMIWKRAMPLQKNTMRSTA